MQLSQIPTMVPLPFAENGTKNTIPEASQIGVTPGAASLNDGFPPLTFTPLAAGGIPPAGADFNGILNLLSANTQWQNAGGFFQYNAAFSTAIGGYPKTALLAKVFGPGYWLNLEDNNTSDPDTGGAGWLAFDPWAIQAAQYITASDTGAVNAYAVALSPTPVSLAPGMLVSIKSISNTNTGAATLAVNGLSTLPILLSQNTPLSGGELIAGYGAIVRLNNAGTAWELIWTGAGSFGIAATKSNAAVNLGQMTDGSLSPTFGDQDIGGNLNVSGDATFSSGFALNSSSYLEVNSPSSGNGANIALTGNGTATPTKYLRASDGELQVINSAYNQVLLNLTDSGDLAVQGTASAAAGTSGGELVNLGQLFIGNRKAVFTSNGTYTVPAGVTQIWVSGAGGGGGGGGGNMINSTTAGGGGGGAGAGQATIKTPIDVTPGEVLTVTIGAGGAGGAGVNALANAANGVGGGATTLTTGATTLLTLSGGGVGGGAYVFADNYVYGGNGFAPGLAIVGQGVSGATQGNIGSGGIGQGTPFGAGGAGGDEGGSSEGGAGAGAGGGGGSSGNPGGDGAAGVLILEW